MVCWVSMRICCTSKCVFFYTSLLDANMVAFASLVIDGSIEEQGLRSYLIST